MNKIFMNYPDVSFINHLSFEDVCNGMEKDYLEKYHELTGKENTLAAADPIRLILHSCAVTIYQAYQMADRSGKMGLLKYSTGAFLDNLAALKGVKRNQAIEAVTTVRFVLSAVQKTDIKIPPGTRIRSDHLFFSTAKESIIISGELEIDVPVRCQEAGDIGNGIPAGIMTTLVDPINYIKSVFNTEPTGGGANEESDEDLAERIFLAPSGYSVAGPEDAYRYWIQTFSQRIGDTCIRSNAPGEVNIYVMFEDGTLPEDTFLRGLEQYLSSSHIRPLTDKVAVKPVEVVEYDIDATYYIPRSLQSMENTIKENVEKACKGYISWQKNQIGRDINPSYFTHLLIEAGAKWAEIRLPIQQTVPEYAVAAPEAVNLVYGGLEDD